VTSLGYTADQGPVGSQLWKHWGSYGGFATYVGLAARATYARILLARSLGPSLADGRRRYYLMTTNR